MPRGRSHNAGLDQSDCENLGVSCNREFEAHQNVDSLKYPFILYYWSENVKKIQKNSKKSKKIFSKNSKILCSKKNLKISQGGSFGVFERCKCILPRPRSGRGAKKLATLHLSESLFDFVNSG